MGRFPNFWSTEPLFHRVSRTVTVIQDPLRTVDESHARHLVHGHHGQPAKRVKETENTQVVLSLCG